MVSFGTEGGGEGGLGKATPVVSRALRWSGSVRSCVSVYPRSSLSSFSDRGLRFSLLGGARAGKELRIFVAPPLSGGGESSLVYIGGSTAKRGAAEVWRKGNLRGVLVVGVRSGHGWLTWV